MCKTSYMQKNKITLLCDIPNTEDGTSWYRAIGPLSHLQKHSELSIDINVTDDISWPILDLCDVFFSQRPFTNKHLKNLTLAKDLGVPIWLDYDDDLFAISTDNPAYNIFGTQDVQNNITQALNMADVVSVSTLSLADNLWNRGFKKNFVVINNALNFKKFNWNSKPRPRSNKVFWRGSASHFRDVLTVTNDFVDLITKSEGFEFQFIGDSLWFLTERCPPEKIKMIRPLTVNKYFSYIYEQAPKLFVAPLLTSKFNMAKSNIAYLEAIWSGALCVCPDMPEWRQTGALNYTNPSHFRSLVKQVMDMSEEDHSKLWVESLEHIYEHYNLDKVNKARESLLRGFM